MKIETKLKAGKVMWPTTLTIDEDKDYIFVAFKYNRKLVEEIKMMQGAHWCLYDTPPQKIWRIDYSPRNIFQLKYLQGKNPYSVYDQEIAPNDYTRPLYQHQRIGADFLLSRRRAILAAEMGCVDGDTIVTTRKGAVINQVKYRLKDFYLEFHSARDRRFKTEKHIDYTIQVLVGNRVRYHYVYNVLQQGPKHCIKLLLHSGKSLVCTPDHEIGIEFDSFKEARKLSVGELVRVCKDNGYIGYETIVAIEDAGVREVYDIVCEAPYHHFLANNISVHNCGKSLVAIEVMERSGSDDWWYVGPKSAIKAVEFELRKWNCTVHPDMITYNKLVSLAKNINECKIPGGIWLDESSRIKTPTAQRSQAAAIIAEEIHRNNGFLILTSGSPAPKSPLDWYHQAEVACPGFLREGSYAKFRNTLALIRQEESSFGQAYPRVITWWDDEQKCATCGQTLDAHTDCEHGFVTSINQCERLYRRLKGLVLVQFKKDCLDLPEKIYRRIELPPTKMIINLAKTIVTGAKTVAAGLVLLRELSDGFQYVDVETGEKQCPVCFGTGKIKNLMTTADIPADSMPIHTDVAEETICDGCGGTGKIKTYSRKTEQVESPKDEALRDLLDEYSEIGRVVIYAGFTGSVDRCVQICEDLKWNYIRVDGRGWHSDVEGDHLVNFQEELEKFPRMAFIGQPGAAGMGLTLTASPVIIYYSNDFNAESRIQSEDRIHRPGSRGCTIIDLLHLQTDYLVLENLQKKRELQSITMGDLTNAFKDET